MPIQKNRVMTAKEVAKELGITASGVDKLETSAFKKLRRNPILFLNYMESLEKDRRSTNVGSIPTDELYGCENSDRGSEE